MIENSTTPDTIETIQRTTLVLRMKDGIASLANVFKIIEVGELKANDDDVVKCR